MESDSPPRRRINKTSDLPRQNDYTLALLHELSHVAFSEEEGPKRKGRWRADVFKVDASVPIDLEIGTGNGLFFAHQAQKFPSRCLLGLELKYKPLIQTIRRALRNSCKNAAVVRFHAFNLDELFADQEVNDVYIHFPDPWVAPRKPKNRVFSSGILKQLFLLQRQESRVFFKTDSREYFDWALEEIAKTDYIIEGKTNDLHQSQWVESNFVTAFESIFLRQKIAINYIQLCRPSSGGHQ